MKRHLATLGICLALTPALAQAEGAEIAFEAAVEGASGTATVTPVKNGVFLKISLDGMPPSTWLALHLHETAACDPAGGHEAAGGHFNPGQVEHGWMSETGPHAGDLPNIWSDATGAVLVELHSPLVTWEPGEASVQGRALIVHAKADDYRTQPSGGAGDRLACAAIPAP